MINNIPRFFEDNSENKDHEIMLDYFLGWTLRCAHKDNSAIKVKEASRNILSYLLYGELRDFTVESVKTWKQWNKIDLCAEVVIQTENIGECKFAILFENKMYTHLHHDQLRRYKDIFDEHYNNINNNKTQYEKKYFFLTCHYRECDFSHDFEVARDCKYVPLSFGWLKSQSLLVEETGNDLFDEFWFRYW
jgi:hypothetical protein